MSKMSKAANKAKVEPEVNEVVSADEWLARCQQMVDGMDPLFHRQQVHCREWFMGQAILSAAKAVVSALREGK